ncbi:uncharacterized protein METZ01_LOCUS235639, partial [marine metagenome]
VSSRASLGVVIPSYRSTYLSRVLLALREFPAEEVVVVDSSPDEPELDGFSVRLKHLEERVSASVARNIGAKTVTTDYILFLDSDVLLSNRAQEVIAEILESASA